MNNGVKFNNHFPDISNSNQLYERALPLIPGVTQTLAKGPGQYIKGIAPKYLVRGKGSHVWDADGNEYLDYNMGIGPVSLGYSFPAVDDAIIDQLKDGITFSLMHPLEVEVAELVHRVVPNAESVRFSKTGADVTSAAIRLARAYTGRQKVLCCGYHGWHDWYISVTDRNSGIPDAIKNLSYTFNYNDLPSLLTSVDDEVAAIILEPVVFEEPKNNFLFDLREICNQYGIVLIFDEMWTGFRMSLGGAQEYFNIKADLACFSKAIANGMPVSLLTGKKEIMNLLEKDVFFFTTFGGEALSLAAAKATIEFMKANNVQEYLASQGRKLKEGYNRIVLQNDMDYTKCSGYNFRLLVSFNSSAGDPLELKSLVQQELIKRGIIWSGSHNLSFSHSDTDIDYTLSAYEEVLPILKKAVDEKNVRKYLKGIPVEPVFRKVDNFNMKPHKKPVKVFDDYKM
jgi:glutamate-1-semialdehyde aminotransferase